MADPMRKEEDMAWYQVDGEDGNPRACHGIKRLMPEGSKEITEAQANEISTAVRSREPKPTAAVATASAGGVDLQPLQDQITRIAQSVSALAQGQKSLVGGGT
ncbi:MAG TPA: hypothetical protein VHC71_04325 [Hyphomicrobium sp.]|nr:hypothetical protein [Hyphomicrobium sp.]